MIGARSVRKRLFFGLCAVVVMSSGLTACGTIFGGTENKVNGAYIPRGKDLNVWFVKTDDNNLSLSAVGRPKISTDALTSAVEELLQGPGPEEVNKGIGTEIPRGTILLGIKHNGSNVELDLSKRFAAGGGPTSMKTRLEQLSRTVRDVEGDIDVFVNIEGQRLTASSADGLEIAQPINRQPEFN
ncbi:MAG: GerMN domain-containing protein [Candidatus Obscuribacterales bacterium]|nr:GerMN domain-containing protein [Candidatus Obscuribacterales bacterium]